MENKKKMTIELTEKATKFYNEVAYSLETPYGVRKTASFIISTLLEELSDFEDVMDINVTGFLEDLKSKEDEGKKEYKV